MFKEKIVLVTGSSRSLGATILKKFYEEGATVIINYNNSEDKAHLLNDNLKDRSMLVKCDVSKEDEVKQMIDSIIEKYGRIDILVNNAGIANDTIFNEKKKDDFDFKLK